MIWTSLRFLEPFAHIVNERSAGSTIVMISYGYNAQPPNDPFLHIAEVAMKGFSKASEPGAFMVDRFPFREHYFLALCTE